MATAMTRADYDQLKQIADRFGGAAEKAQQRLQTIQQCVQVLQSGDWVGAGATAFYAEMNDEVLPSLRRLVKALKSAQRVTLQIAREIKQAEDEAAALLHDTGATVGRGSSGGRLNSPNKMGLAQLGLPQDAQAEQAWHAALQSNATLREMAAKYQASPSVSALAGIREFLCGLLPFLCEATPTPTATPTPPPAVTIFPTQPYLASNTPMPTALPVQPTVTPQPTGYPTPPPVVQHSQYEQDIVKDFRYNACGLVSFAAAAEALGLSYSDVMSWFQKNAYQYGYTPKYGMQPSNYLKSVQSLISEKGLPVIATQVYGLNDTNTIQKIKQELVSGNQVIVDLLAQSPSNRTTPSGSTSQYPVPSTYAHFARIVGFSSDGKTVYLAESLNSNNTTVAVNTADLLQSMKNPEGRSEFNAASAESIDNWVMIIGRL